MVSHLDGPFEILKEAFRVVKPGGLVGIFDGDYASMTFGQEDSEKAKELDELIVSAMVTSPQVMRQKPRIFQAVELEVVDCFPYVLAEVGEMDFWKPGIESLRMFLPKSGAMTEGEANKFADGLVKDSERGIFFGASNFYAYIGRRP